MLEYLSVFSEIIMYNYLFDLLCHIPFIVPFMIALP